MIKPYIPYEERFGVYHKTLVGASWMLNLRFEQLKREMHKVVSPYINPILNKLNEWLA